MARSGVLFSLVVVTAVGSGCSLVLGDDGLSGGGGAAGDGGAVLPPPTLVDCRDPNHSGDFTCRTIDALQPGSVGEGPAPSWLTPTGIRQLQAVAGVIRNGELFLAVKSSSQLGEGGILGVSLATGARRLVSGTLKTTSGTLTQGSGDNFANLSGVGFGGGLFAHIWPEWQGFTGFILDIDAATGNHTTRAIGDKCESALPQPLNKEDWIPPAVAPDSTVYLAAANLQGEHLVRVLGDDCELLTTLALPSALGALRWQAGKLWMSNDAGSVLAALDLQTGKTTTVSQTDPPVPGMEPVTLGTHDIAVSGNAVWTVGSLFEGGFHLVEVNTATGARTLHDQSVGPARTEPQSRELVFAHPSLAAVVVVVDGAVVIYDPATDNSNVLSF